MSAADAEPTQQNSIYNHDTDHLNTITSTDNLRQASTESVPEPTPTEQPKHVNFTSDTNKIHPAAIKAPTSNSITNTNPSVQITPNENDHRVRDILHNHGLINTQSQTIRSLQYLHSVRVKDNLYPNQQYQQSPFSRSQYTNDTCTHFDELEEEESKMNNSISDWTLKFVSPIREKQFRIFVTERYGTSIRVAILAMIVAYIFLAGTNESFIKDTVQIIFVCLGLSVMLITFSIASSFSRASSSSTISYLKSLFQANKTITNTDTTISNGKQNYFSKISTYCLTLFGLYSNFMTALCVLSLLLLLILQNTIGESLPDDKFLVYYLLSSLVASIYGSLGYRVYLICAWSLWLFWNILAISVTQSGSSEQNFDFWSINIVLIIAQLVLGHQVKAKERARRKSFLRVMNYVNRQQSQSQKTNGPYDTPKAMHAYDITTVPTYRDKLMNVLENVVDKSLVGRMGTDNSNFNGSSAFSSAGSIYHQSPRKSPRKMGYFHARQKSKLYDAMRRDLTKRGTDHSHGWTGQNDAASELGTKLGLINKRESNALGIFNMIRGLGGNLCHLETQHEEFEVDDIVAEQNEFEAGNDMTLLETVESGQKFEKKLTDDDKKQQTINDENYQKDMHVFFTNSLQNTEPHCGSVHELPNWYGATIESYILTGYRVNYDTILCLKSMFEKHNETMNIWTEFIPAFILCIVIIYFNTDNNGHFWANSNVYNSYTKILLYVSLFFIITRPIISGLAHTFTCISKKSSKIWWKLDFLSIIVAAGFGSVVWIHCIFYCEKNLQTLYMFAILALSFSTTITALTTKNSIIRDLSLGAFFVFTLIFLYLYELYLLFLSPDNKNMPYITMTYWTISVLCTLSAVMFRASKYPEAFFVKRRFKKLMKNTYQEKFSIPVPNFESKDDEKIDSLIHKKQTSLKPQISFAKMLQDIQSFTIETENRLAKIENMDKQLYSDINMNNESLKNRKIILEKEIDALENEIVNEIKNEMTIEQCLESAYLNLISNDNKQWFNYLFTSHNFWHIFMNLAVMFTVVAWKEYFNWRAQQRNWC